MPYCCNNDIIFCSPKDLIHPQLFVLPVFKALASTIQLLPQEHLHNQNILVAPDGVFLVDTRRITVN